MTRLNELTKRLLAMGYTENNHPDYVKEYNKYYGGFEYTLEYQNRMVFETGCGLLIKGSHWNAGYMSYMGIDWKVENNNPTIKCPYLRNGCEKNHPDLRDNGVMNGGTSVIVHCSCHQTDKEYDYEKSVDKINDERNRHIDEMYREFEKSKSGRACRIQSIFDERDNKWYMHYSPIICAQNSCHYCNILGRELSSKKGNVFYDLKTVNLQEGEGLFPDKRVISVVKGKRFLNKQCSIDICNQIVKLCKFDIQKREEMKHHSKLFFAEHYGKTFEIEVLNVRAEARESRDLEQDLMDIAEGIKISHESDNEKLKKQIKRDNRDKSIEARKRKYLKMIEQSGIDNIDTKFKRRIEKLINSEFLTSEEINRAEKLYQDSLMQTQMTLF